MYTFKIGKKGAQLLGSAVLCGAMLVGCGQETAETPVAPEQETSVPEGVTATEGTNTTESATEELTDVQHFGMFIANTLEGTEYMEQEISDTIFHDYDLTMVNIWATWCGPCVEEMPYLQEVYSQLPSNVNLITLVSDGDQQLELAQEILGASGATFTTVLPSESVNLNVLPKVDAFPTTVFVDRNGNVAAVTQGVPQGDVTASYLDYVDQVLVALEGIGMSNG